MARIAIVRLAFCFLFLSVAFVAFAQKKESDPTEDKQTASEPVVPLKDYREVLQQERKLLEDQSEKYYARIDKLIDRTTYGLGILVIFALALFWWVFGKTKKDLVIEIRAELEKDIRLSLQKDLERIQAEVAELRDSRRASWIFNPGTTNVEKDAKRLRASGLKNITLYPETVGKILNLAQYDLVILSYDGSEEMSRKLNEVVGILDLELDKTPLLIHTPNATISDEEIKLLDDYQAYSLAKVTMVFYDRALSLSRLGKIQK